jgi:hypothetical protein
MNQKTLGTVSVFGIFMTANFKVRNVEVDTDPQGHTEYGSGFWLRQICSWDYFLPTQDGMQKDTSSSAQNIATIKRMQSLAGARGSARYTPEGLGFDSR